jgi:chromosome segregation ATPase
LEAEHRRKDELLQPESDAATTVAAIREELSKMVLELGIEENITSWHSAQLEVSTAAAAVRGAWQQRQDSKSAEVKALEKVYQAAADTAEKAAKSIEACTLEAVKQSLRVDLKTAERAKLEALGKLKAKRADYGAMASSDKEKNARLERLQKAADQAATELDAARKAHIKATGDEETLLQVL